MILVVDEKCRLRIDSRGSEDDNAAFVVRLFLGIMADLCKVLTEVDEVPATARRTRSGELLLERQKKRGDDSLIDLRKRTQEERGVMAGSKYQSSSVAG